MDTVQANIDPNQVGVPGDVLNAAIDNFGATGSADPFDALTGSTLFGGTDPLYASDGTSLVTAPKLGGVGAIGSTFASVQLWVWLAAGGIVAFAMLRR